MNLVSRMGPMPEEMFVTDDYTLGEVGVQAKQGQSGREAKAGATHLEVQV